MHLKPIRRDGKVVVPLTRRTSGLQALKVVHPPSRGDEQPQPRSHDGYLWTYVLNGVLRLVLDGNDLVLGAGEVAEFDTHVPHWFTSAGPEPAESIVIYGPNGERMRQLDDLVVP